MSRGEFLTRLTIWFALAGYTVGSGCYMLSRSRRRWDSAARLVWTFACASLLAHVACAFHFYHGWSHAAAFRDTARQTAEVVGFNWGGGLYINYVVVAGWMADIIWWWRGLDAYRRRSWLVAAAWQGFLLFIFFNATFVFKDGFLRWFSLCLYLGLAVLWWRGAEGKTGSTTNTNRDTITKDQTHELTGH